MAIQFGNLDRELADRQNVIKEDAARQYRGSRDTMKSITDLGQTISTEVKNYKANQREDERLKYNMLRNEESDDINREKHGMYMMKGELDAMGVMRKSSVDAWNLKKWKGGTKKQARTSYDEVVATWRDDVLNSVDQKIRKYPGLYSQDARNAVMRMEDRIGNKDYDIGSEQHKQDLLEINKHAPVSMMRWAVNAGLYDDSDYGDPNAESDVMMTRIINKYSSITGMSVPDATDMLSKQKDNTKFIGNYDPFRKDSGSSSGDAPEIKSDPFASTVGPKVIENTNLEIEAEDGGGIKNTRGGLFGVRTTSFKTKDNDAVVPTDTDATNDNLFKGSGSGQLPDDSVVSKKDDTTVVEPDASAPVSRSSDTWWKNLFLGSRDLSGTDSNINADDNPTTTKDPLATAASSTDKQQKQAFIKANTPKADSYKPQQLVLDPAPFEMTQSQVLQNLRTLEDNGLSRGLPIDDNKRVIAAGSVDANLLVGRGDARSGNADNIIEMLGITDPGKKKEWKSYLMSDSVNSDYGHGKKGKLTTDQEYKRLQLRLTSEQTDTLMGWAYNKSMKEVNNNFGFNENTYKKDQGGVPYLKHIIGDMGYRHGSSFMKKGDSGNYPKFGRAVQDLTEATNQGDQLVAYNKMNKELFSTGIYSDLQEGTKGKYKKNGGTNRFKFLRDRMDKLKSWITRGQFTGNKITLYDPERGRRQDRLTELENNMQKSFILNQEAKNRLDEAAVNEQIRLQNYENSPEGIIDDIENPKYMMNKQYQGLRLAN